MIISYVLSLIIETDSNLYVSQPVIIKIHDVTIPGHIYTIRGDGRYTIRYLNKHGEPNLKSFKRFEFEILHPVTDIPYESTKDN